MTSTPDSDDQDSSQTQIEAMLIQLKDLSELMIDLNEKKLLLFLGFITFTTNRW